MLEKICCKEAASDGLSPVYLQIMINQYIFADPDLRESYGSAWVETVVYNPEKASFFPRATKVRKMLEAVIPTVIDQNPCAHLRMPRDMIFHGWSMRLFQAWQHSATMSS